MAAGMKSEKELLKMPGNPWALEHVVTDQQHYATWTRIIPQHQIVTKGKWVRNAEWLLNQQGLTHKGSPRPVQTLREHLRGKRRNLSFMLFGFTSFRIKRWLRG